MTFFNLIGRILWFLKKVYCSYLKNQVKANITHQRELAHAKEIDK